MPMTREDGGWPSQPCEVSMTRGCPILAFLWVGWVFHPHKKIPPSKGGLEPAPGVVQEWGTLAKGAEQGLKPGSMWGLCGTAKAVP